MARGTKRTGSCLCGALSFAVETTSDSVGACHCSMCRKWAGGPLLAIECGSDLRFEGEDAISVYGSSEWAGRGFCGKCGSHLFYRLKNGENYAIPVGLLDDAGQLTLEEQIFIDEKPSFYSFANETKNMTGAEAFAKYGAVPD